METKWIRQPQEQDGTYRFNGQFLVTAGVNRLLSPDEKLAIYTQVQSLVAKNSGYFFHPYFVKKKTGRFFQSISAIDLTEDERIVPDAVFKVSDGDQSRHFLFELHNGRSIRRLKDQILNHAIALTQRKTHAAFDIPVEQFYYVLIVLENDAAFESLISEMKELKSQYQNIHQFFLCKSLAQVEGLTFWKNWTSILGEQVEFQI
jgi:predicted RNA binding protein with dsRBD fold (UPF0201 family)